MPADSAAKKQKQRHLPLWLHAQVCGSSEVGFFRYQYTSEQRWIASLRTATHTRHETSEKGLQCTGRPWATVGDLFNQT